MGGVRGRMNQATILEGANGILDSGKYGDLTVDALARSLRMSKSTLYKYFNSKEDVVIALVTEACDATDAEIERTIAGGTPDEQLAELARIIGRHGARLPRAVITQVEKLPGSCIKRLRATRELFSDSAFALVEQGVSRKVFKHPDPHLVAVAFIASAEAILRDVAESGRNAFEPSLNHLPDLFVTALRANAK
jgi:AcrR family transcriptional regulator